MKYGWTRKGHKPKPLTWHAVSDCLPAIEDLSGLQRSQPVLLCLRNGYSLVGFLQQYDEDFPAEWKLSGQDSYTAEGVTHWRWLPVLPEQKGG